mgnify:CR=1 FL=1
MWTMITISCLFGLGSLAVMNVVITTGIIGTVVMRFVVLTAREQ